MVFVSSLTPPKAPEPTPLENLVAMPHRLFFFGGIVQTLFLIALLLFQYGFSASLNISTTFYHVYGMSFGAFTQFFVGFLLTVFPRYLARPNPPKSSYLLAGVGINIGALSLFIAAFSSNIFLWIAFVLIFISYVKLFWELVKIQLESKVENKTDTTWLLISFGFGLFGQILLILSNFYNFEILATGVTFYLYLFFVVMTVSQKMIPFFAANVMQNYTMKKSKYFLHILFFALITKVLLLEFGFNSLLADLVIFITITYELVKWRLPFKGSPAILWVLFLSIWWSSVGFLLFVIDGFLKLFGSSFHLGDAPLHALALGYFTTVLVGFGTRVLLGHSGREPVADKYTAIIFYLIQVMTLIRISADVFNGFYLHAIVLAVIFWFLVFGWWSGRFGKILFEK
ncbi:MAG: NnrS family protein [Sulfurospirillaceae bacterium]|nr:NnrS family protein [Sulfurospirillaceae bacterium]